MIVGIIPARYASTRLPGKPLSEIGGKPMIQHTYESVLQSTRLDKVIIATDDVRIEKAAFQFEAPVLLTPQSIKTGSDRIAYAALKEPRAEIIVNIQGDEPFLSAEMIDKAIEPLLFDREVEVATLMKKISSEAELLNPSVVKVVYDYNNNALYFSRSPIPYLREQESLGEAISEGVFFKHLGLYVYRREALFKFYKLLPTDLEQIEKLEQLRMLENGMKIKVVETDIESITVDTPEDLEMAREFYEKNLKGKDHGN